jgi:TDG/mug DNA glycosylase family protein
VRSALTGHHFAGYSNRFWKLLHESRLVADPMTSEQDVTLPSHGYGITNLVPRCTPGIDTLRPEEYAEGRTALLKKIERFKPAVVALVGVTLYRALFGPAARGPVTLGLQSQTIHGSRVFVLPNPSGRNANYSHAEMLAAFQALRRFLGRSTRLRSRSLHAKRP